MYKSRFLVPFLLFSGKCQRNIQSILANHRIDSVVQTAWVLLLLVSLSLPIIKPLYILEVESKVTPSIQTSIATSIRFGVWGMCLGAYEFGYESLEPPHFFIANS